MVLILKKGRKRKDTVLCTLQQFDAHHIISSDHLIAVRRQRMGRFYRGLHFVDE
jgi:hypothetical protein